MNSAALQTSAIVRDGLNLDRWLNHPDSVAPGQRMGYSLGDAALRADVIACLAGLPTR